MPSKRNIKEDYLRGEDSLHGFYNYSINNPDFRKIMEQKKYPESIRQVVSAYFRQQYASLELSEKTALNLQLIESPNTYTITTGHQLCLFGGPLFTIYKILSTVCLAETLKEQYPENHFIPVFWIHGEDHDFEEINHYFINFYQKKTYPSSFSGNTGKHLLTADILPLIPESFPEDLQQAYRPGKRMDAAYFHFFHLLLDEYGVLILNADTPELKKCFIPMMKKELSEGLTFEAVTQTGNEMTELGYPVQISPREINLFLMNEAGRNRIEKADKDSFVVRQTGSHFSLQEMLDLLENNPERFSPNVCLRPLYQETILPDLAYVGGWAEVSYWLQLKGIFEKMGIPFPLVLPRISATLWLASDFEEWQKLGLLPEEIRKTGPAAEKKLLYSVWNPEEWTKRKASVLKSIEDLQGFLTEEAPALSRTTLGMQRKTEYYLHRAEQKLLKQKKMKYRELFDAFRTLKARVQPDGLIQERVLGLAAFPDFSPQELIHKIKPFCNPLDFSHRDILLLRPNP